MFGYVPPKPVAVNARKARGSSPSRRAAAGLIILLAAHSASCQAERCFAERRRAAATADTIRDEWSIRPADSLTRYFAKVGTRLIANAGYSNESWRFIVVRNLSSNAFSIGDGYIFINEGALLKAQTEAEFAAVVAHEIGHQIAGHFCQAALKKPKRKSGFNPFNWGADEPEKPQREKKLGSITQKIDLKKELEADRKAVELLKGAGFNPHAILQVARRFPKFGERSDKRNQIRIKELKSLLYDLPRPATPASAEFSAAKNQLQRELR